MAISRWNYTNLSAGWTKSYKPFPRYRNHIQTTGKVITELTSAELRPVWAIMNRRLRGNLCGGICMRAATTNSGAKHMTSLNAYVDKNLANIWGLKKQRQTPKHEIKYYSMKYKCFVWLWFSYYRPDAFAFDPFDCSITWIFSWASDKTSKSTFRSEHNQFCWHVVETKMHT